MIETQPGLLTVVQTPYDLGLLAEHGYRWLSFQVQNGTALKSFDLGPARRAGLSPGVWGVTYGKDDQPDPDVFYRDGLALARQAVAMGAEHVQVDAEMCAKFTRDNRGLAPIIAGIRDGGWSDPVHLSTLGAPANPSVNDFEMDVQSFLETGGGIFPQAYANETDDYLPELCVQYWTRVGVPATRLNLMIGLYFGAQGRIDGDDWIPLLEDAGVAKNLSVFMAEFGTERDYVPLEVITLAPDTPWWQLPYPTNPSPPAVQQPRWLYPPDVGGGYEHSPDGQDVQAYKRAVARLGRWPWPVHNFDGDYSNGFAHGKAGGQVADSGIAGIQRQAGLDDTGNLGAKVFQILRTAIIPPGLPNAGEPAMDQQVLALLNGRKWWQYPYEQGPGPKIAFPRPIYVPSWKEQPDPAPGPDVQAYKRAVSRLGRWPWQQFSTAYTDEFGLGTSGNVGDTGVAGVQRQTPHLDDTGNLSAKVFETLRRALIPPCLPNAHQQAFDQKALELLKQAIAQMPGESVREQALDAARGQIGYTESPPGSNQNRFGEWYGMNGEPWCAMFVTWAYETGTAGGSPSFAKGSYYAYVPYIVSDARNGLRGLSVTQEPIPGDLVCFDWAWDGTFDHVGMVESGNPDSFQSIEGNTSTSNQSNGGQVMRRSRSFRDADLVFVRVAE